jgi:hypothetical protein
MLDYALYDLNAAMSWPCAVSLASPAILVAVSEKASDEME